MRRGALNLLLVALLLPVLQAQEGASLCSANGLVARGKLRQAEQRVILDLPFHAWDARIWILLGDIESKLGRYSDAIAAYEAAESLGEGTTAHRAEVLLQLQQWQQAERLLEQDPGLADPALMAVVYCRQGRPGKGMEVLTSHAVSPCALCRALSEYCLATGNPREACHWATRSFVLETTPDLADYADFLFRAGRLRDSLDFMLQHREQLSERVESHVLQIRIFDMWQDWESAQRACCRSQKLLDKRLHPELRAYALLVCGIVSKKSGKTLPAIALLQQSYAVAPRGRTAVILAETLRAANRHHEALQLLSKHVEQDPLDTTAAIGLCEIHLNRRRFAEVVRLCKKGLDTGVPRVAQVRLLWCLGQAQVEIREAAGLAETLASPLLPSPNVAYLKGRHEYLRGEFELARRAWRDSAAAGFRSALVDAAELAFVSGEKRAAARRVGELLRYKDLPERDQARVALLSSLVQGRPDTGWDSALATAAKLAPEDPRYALLSEASHLPSAEWKSEWSETARRVQNGTDLEELWADCVRKFGVDGATVLFVASCMDPQPGSANQRALVQEKGDPFWLWLLP